MIMFEEVWPAALLSKLESLVALALHPDHQVMDHCYDLLQCRNHTNLKFICIQAFSDTCNKSFEKFPKENKFIDH